MCWTGMSHTDIYRILNKLKEGADICNTFNAVMKVLPDAIINCKYAASAILMGSCAVDHVVRMLRAKHFSADLGRVMYKYGDSRSEDLCQDVCEVACHVLNVHSILQRASVSSDCTPGEFTTVLVAVECVYMELIQHSTLIALVKVFGTTNRACVNLVVHHAIAKFETEAIRWHVIDFFRSCGTTLHGKDKRPTGLPIAFVSPQYNNGSLAIVHYALQKLTSSSWRTVQNVNDAIDRMHRIRFIQYGCDFFLGSTRGFARDQRHNIPLDDIVRHTFRERSSGNTDRIIKACAGKHGVVAMIAMIRNCRMEYLAPTHSSGVDDMCIIAKLAESSECPTATNCAIQKILQSGVACRRAPNLKGLYRGKEGRTGKIQCVLMPLMCTKNISMLLTLLRNKCIVKMLEDHLCGGCPAGRCNVTKTGNTHPISHFNLLASMAMTELPHIQRNISIIMKVYRAYVQRRRGDIGSIDFLAGHKHCERHEVAYFRVFAPLALKYGSASGIGKLRSLDMMMKAIHPMAVPILVTYGGDINSTKMMQKMIRVYYRPCKVFIATMFQSRATESTSMMWNVMSCLCRDDIFIAQDMVNKRRCSDVITLLFSFMVSFFKCRGALRNTAGDVIIKTSCASERLSRITQVAIPKFESMCARIGVTYNRKTPDFWCVNCRRSYAEGSRTCVICDWRCSANRQSEWIHTQLLIYSRPCHLLTRYGLSPSHRLVFFKQRFDMLDYSLRAMLFTLILIKQRACSAYASPKDVHPASGLFVRNRMPTPVLCTFRDDLLFEHVVRACCLISK
jgi:hypothetical protein